MRRLYRPILRVEYRIVFPLGMSYRRFARIACSWTNAGKAMITGMKRVPVARQLLGFNSIIIDVKVLSREHTSYAQVSEESTANR
jgi:hypothetical protein